MFRVLRPIQILNFKLPTSHKSIFAILLSLKIGEIGEIEKLDLSILTNFESAV